jgi:anti-sigma regulatory factor (Ser/Thr protein kinase)
MRETNRLAAYLPSERSSHEGHSGTLVPARSAWTVAPTSDGFEAFRTLGEPGIAARWACCLENDPAQVPSVVQLLRAWLICSDFCDAPRSCRIGIAVIEALSNAIFHGNLELNSELREHGDLFYRLAEKRRNRLPYCNRRVFLSAGITAEAALFRVRDEGNGFDPRDLSDPREPGNILHQTGRGLLLIRHFMDEVHFNAAGNEITMRLHRR